MKGQQASRRESVYCWASARLARQKKQWADSMGHKKLAGEVISHMGRLARCYPLSLKRKSPLLLFTNSFLATEEKGKRTSDLSATEIGYVM